MKLHQVGNVRYIAQTVANTTVVPSESCAPSGPDECHEPALMDLKFDRAFESLRKDPRFIVLERRIGVIE